MWKKYGGNKNKKLMTNKGEIQQIWNFEKQKKKDDEHFDNTNPIMEKDASWKC